MRVLMVNNFRARLSRNTLSKRELLDDVSQFQEQGFVLSSDFRLIPNESTLDPVFRATNVTALGSNAIFYLHRKHFPDFFVLEEARNDAHLSVRLFAIESAVFLKNIVLAFQPHLSGMQDGILKDHLHVVPDAFPAFFVGPLLEYISLVEKTSAMFHLQQVKRVLGGDDVRAIIFRSQGDEEQAVTAARTSADKCVQLLDQLGARTFSHVISPLFTNGACFLQYRRFEDLNMVMTTLAHYSGLHSIATQALEVLSTAKARILAEPVEIPKLAPFMTPSPSDESSPADFGQPPHTLSTLTPQSPDSLPPLSSPQIWLATLQAGVDGPLGRLSTSARVWEMDSSPVPGEVQELPSSVLPMNFIEDVGNSNSFETNPY